MSLFEKVISMDHEQVVFCNDKRTNLRAIIAIHNTALGPALGGCRMWAYTDEQSAVTDVLRLSRGMTYKAAVAGLGLGGGKSVIVGDPKQLKSEEFFRAFGKFVNSLNGRYITAEDVNIKVADMEHVAKETKHVTGLSSIPGGSGDPSPITALGVFHGLRAAVKFKLGTDDLKGLRVAVKGAGAVGSYLCQYLHDVGVQLVVADINKEREKQVCERYGAKQSSVDTIHSEDVDVFAPCALGGDLNDQSIPQIKAKVIAGGANNQLLEEDRHGKQIYDAGILYAPDYVINAGGLINVYQEMVGYDVDKAKEKTGQIYETLMGIFEESKSKGLSTHEASDALAERKVAAASANRLSSKR